MAISNAALLEQAKQGDAKAISTLLNYKLQPKGINAKVSIKNSCLHILLESAKTPPQQPLVEFIRKTFTSFAIDSWHTVKVYGRRRGEEIPDWGENFKVEPETAQDLVILAQQGDIKALATLIKQWLKPSDITAKVSLKGDCLQIMLEAMEVPNQQQMVSLLQTEILKLRTQSITSLRLYGKQSGEDFPDWHEDFSLTVDNDYSQQIEAVSLDSSISSESKEVVSILPVKKINGVKLSNQLYIALQTVCYQHFNRRVELENNKTIHEIVTHFSDSLEADLKLELDQFSKQDG